jgi:type IV pilus assembly protein PilC
MSTVLTQTQDRTIETLTHQEVSGPAPAVRPQGTPVVEWSERLFLTRVRPGDLILFTTQLAVMLDSGVVLSDALDAIAEQAGDPRFQAVILDISKRVKSGDTFSKALSHYPHAFNTMFTSMVKASEASGKMVEMLNVLTGYLSFESDTRKQIRGALTYPFIMVLMAIAATGTLMFFVLPRFMQIYSSRGAALPKLTQVLVGFSKILGNFELMTVLITTALVGGGLLWYWTRTTTGRRLVDGLKIHTPIIGTMFVDMVVTRSMRIMSTMVNTCAPARRGPRHPGGRGQLLFPAAVDPGR